jgi:methionyl-tRNA formyltransferase
MTRAIFLGQKPIGEDCLRILLGYAGRGMEVVAAVSNADPGQTWWQTAGVREAAEARGIPFLPNDQRYDAEIRQLMRDTAADTLISVQHSWILPGETLAQVGNRAFNLHNAKLPDYRGYNACSHALLNGDTTYTSTIHWMVPDVDKGGAAFEETFDIAPDETARSLHAKAMAAGLRAFENLAAALAAGIGIPSRPLADGGVFYGRKSLDVLRQIVNPADPGEVDCKCRALYFPPFEPAYYLENGRKIQVLPAIPETAGQGRDTVIGDKRFRLVTV